MYCNKCGKKIDKDDDFCRSCGAKQNKKKTSGLKLVAARCPSCGSNIEVDKNKETTKCEYCGTRIIIDDAIEKYKIEISGGVEIKNLPNVDNLLKNANNYYENGEYRDALIKYDALLDLDPNQHFAMLRRSLCKMLLTDVFLCDINALLTNFNRFVNNVLDPIDKAIGVKETLRALITMNNSLKDSFYNLNRITHEDIGRYLTALLNYNVGLESVVFHIIDYNDLDNAYYRIIDNLLEVIHPRSYASGTYNKYGTEWYFSYKLDKEVLNNTKELFKKYLELYKNVNVSKFVDFEEKYYKIVQSQKSNLITFIMCAILIGVIIFCIVFG